MQKVYKIFSEGDGFSEIQFDDDKSVRQLVHEFFDLMGYYEPYGMDIVTLFNAHSSKSTNGWFIVDPDEKCSAAIESPDELCIAYHMPNMFYFAEGGWGHHMEELGNHPHLDNPVSLNFHFEDFRNTVVIAGNIKMCDMINSLKEKDYISDSVDEFIINDLEKGRYVFPFSALKDDETVLEFSNRFAFSDVILEIKEI